MKRMLMFLIFLLAMIDVVGCAKTDIEELPIVRGETPPLPSLKSGENEIPVVLGSHSWKSDVDMAGPIELLKDNEPTPIAGDAKVKVVFDYKPNPSEIYIREFDPNSGAYISERKLDSDSFALWTISSRGGPRIYAIDARWGVDKNVVSAQATYYFQVAIEGIADSSGSEKIRVGTEIKPVINEQFKESHNKIDLERNCRDFRSRQRYRLWIVYS